MKLAFLVVLLVLVSGCTSPAGDRPLENKDSWVGKEIALEGTTVIVKRICTAAFCEDNPCCNSCSAVLGLNVSGEVIALRGSYEGKPIKCAGSNCAMECNPEEGKAMAFKGVLRNDGGFYLEVS